MPDPNEYVRVTDKDTGHRHSVRRSELPHGNYSELKQAAVHPLTLEPLPPEFKSVETNTTSGQSAGTKES